ncbi:hypothetical protein IPL85_05545 [Candidatus Saccharibacteria bacterium]|nr:MAG: hypothetical protein IPL85_05545 [Candidatus Saccharibacteria bacterium]
MSIHPNDVETPDPFEGLDYIPKELRTLDKPPVPITVINCDPALNVRDPHDLFGLEILLGGLAGVRPFGVQTEARMHARSEFSSLVARGLINPELLSDLGHVGCTDLSAKKLTDSSDLAAQIAATNPKKAVVIITPDTVVWQPLKQAVKKQVRVAVYRAEYKRRSPPTERGMKWTITADSNNTAD